MLAEELINELKMIYPRRAIKVEVYEDDINGCILDFEPEAQPPVNHDWYVAAGGS